MNRQKDLSLINNKIKLEKALEKMAKQRCFVCNNDKIVTMVSMFAKIDDDEVWCDVSCCEKCKRKIESD